jgi:prepilin-type N-terminal cleavage/methylation domain-containing protein
MLTKLMAMPKAALKAKLQGLDVSAVKGRSLKRQFEKIRNKAGGFTLLELLVVVAILAAIAGTATIMLQDTDRKGAAAAHVAMMDELSKGIQTFRVLNGGLYPDIWDSLLGDKGLALTTPTTAADATTIQKGLSAILSDDLVGNLGTDTLGQDGLKALHQVGITRVRELRSDTGCLDAAIREHVANKDNDVTPQNIYRPGENGCGKPGHSPLKKDSVVAVWTGGDQRVGLPILPAGGTPSRLVAFGVGADSTLFEPARIGALSNVPVYRHVASDEYNRFIVLFNLNPVVEVVSVATAGESEPEVTLRSAGGQASFQAIIDGAGDTKDEELGEVDNVRPT